MQSLFTQFLQRRSAFDFESNLLKSINLEVAKVVYYDFF